MKPLRFLFGVLVAVAAPFPAFAGVDLTDGLVGYWNFDEGGGDVAHDQSGKGHDGQVMGSQWVDGKPGTALQFTGDGTVSRVTIDNSADLEITGDISIALWTKSSTTKHCGIVQKGGFDYWVFLSSSHVNTPALGSMVWNPAEVMADSALPDNQWTHIVAVHNQSSGDGTIYVNGVKAGYPILPANMARPLAKSGRPLYIGTDDNPWRGYPGVVDEVRIYAKALSADEAKAVYEYQGVQVNAFVLRGPLRIVTGQRGPSYAVLANGARLFRIPETGGRAVEVPPFYSHGVNVAAGHCRFVVTAGKNQGAPAAGGRQ